MGPTEEVVLAKEAKPLVGSYLERPKPRARAVSRGLLAAAPW